MNGRSLHAHDDEWDCVRVGPLVVRSRRHRIHFMLEYRPQLSSEDSAAPPSMSVYIAVAMTSIFEQKANLLKLTARWRCCCGH